MKMTANIYDLLFDLRDSLHCALEISPANPRTPTILRQNCLRQFIGFTDFEEGSKSYNNGFSRSSCLQFFLLLYNKCAALCLKQKTPL